MNLKKEEKQQIYNLLKTADSFILGYRRNIFAGEPQFSDDEEITEESGSAGDASATEQASAGTSFTTAQASASAPEKSSIAQVSSPAQQASDETQNHSLTLDELNAKMLRCTRCSLARTRNNVVPGQGVPNPLVLVIGEAPGADEDMKGLPFVGKAGVLLDKMLGAINLSRTTNCYIENTVKCRPANHFWKRRFIF